MQLAWTQIQSLRARGNAHLQARTRTTRLCAAGGIPVRETERWDFPPC